MVLLLALRAELPAPPLTDTHLAEDESQTIIAIVIVIEVIIILNVMQIAGKLVL